MTGIFRSAIFHQIRRETIVASFLYGPALRKSIVQTLSGKKRDIAVAFIGKGPVERAQLQNARGARIICDLWSGGCNPEAIRELHKAGAKIRNLRGLHAKVYIGDNAAVTGSANLSSNGFGDHAGQDWDLEAAVLVSNKSELAEIQKWFDRQYKKAKTFDPDDPNLDKAWSRRPFRADVGGDGANVTSIIAHAMRHPSSFQEIGFVFSNSKNDKNPLRDAVKAAKSANPLQSKAIDRWSRSGAFTEWDATDVRKWPGHFFTFHIGPKGKLYLGAMDREISDARGGFVFGSLQWRRISAMVAPSLNRASCLSADRELAGRILGGTKAVGLLFNNARELLEYCRQRGIDPVQD